MNNKLQAKDLINIGLFTVLYFVLGCCVAIPIGFVPIFLPVLGSLWTLITGIPFMLFAVRVKKFGMVTIMAVLSGLLMGFTGMGFWGVPVGLVFGFTRRPYHEVRRVPQRKENSPRLRRVQSVDGRHIHPHVFHGRSGPRGLCRRLRRRVC